ncbi:Metallo-dependent phosphatase [Clavulina sp. PMI_390]|nr:Metallo-dependent phosphatase [Clavulina sp. PMI_390]
MLHASKLAALVAVLSATGTFADVVPELPAIPADLSTPVQTRLAFNGDTGMAVGWNTFKQLSNPKVYYGLSPNKLSLCASSHSSITYPTSRTWSNTIKITGLLPSTTYYYKIDSTNSTVSSFKTARVRGDQTPFTAALVIDMGVFGPDGLSSRTTSYTNLTVPYPLKPGEHTTIQRLVAMKDQYEFVLHPGDFAYADSWYQEYKLGYINGSLADGAAMYQGLNEQFFDELSVVSSIKPYMVTAGNHEANCLNGGSGTMTEASFCPIGQTNFTDFTNRFALMMPGSSSSSRLAKRLGLSGLDDDNAALGEVKRDEMRQALNPRTRRRAHSFADTQIAARDASRAARRTAAAAAAVPPFWYSFDYGMAHFLFIDTETDLGNGIVGPDEPNGGQNDNDGPFGSYPNQQVDFIEKDLSSVDRELTPWVVVAGHRPWYAASALPCPTCQTAFEGLLVKHNVDLGVFGHIHNQQLIMPIKNNQTDPNGWNNPSAPAYVVNGAAGHLDGLESLYFGYPWLNLTYANDTMYGFSQLVFKDRQHLEIQFINSGTGDVAFSQTLFKEHKISL